MLVLDGLFIVSGFLWLWLGKVRAPGRFIFLIFTAFLGLPFAIYLSMESRVFVVCLCAGGFAAFAVVIIFSDLLQNTVKQTYHQIALISCMALYAGGGLGAGIVLSNDVTVNEGRHEFILFRDFRYGAIASLIGVIAGGVAFYLARIDHEKSKTDEDLEPLIEKEDA